MESKEITSAGLALTMLFIYLNLWITGIKKTFM